ncbi:hypothetical protein HYW55_01785 [Candidatus Gottesmanbacteria bacterium]|nr:hypothetical protein [Candidatus Gottesmanbacteria bacterium]
MKLLYGVFILLVLVIVFEIGLYAGVNYNSTFGNKLVPGIPQESTIPTPPPINSIDQSSVVVQSKPADVTVGNPAGKLEFIRSLTDVLTNSDASLVKEGTISYTLAGKITRIDTDATVTLQGKPKEHFFLLQIEDPQTKASTYPYVVQTSQVSISFYSKDSTTGLITEITAQDLAVGDYVEIEEVGNVLTSKMSKETVTRIR